MNVVLPVHFFRIAFDIGQVEIDDHGLLTAAADHTRQRLVVSGVDLLMRYVWRYEDEIARTRFGYELEAVAPSHARASADDVDDAFDRPMVVRAGLGLRMDDDRAGPQLFGAGTRV